MHLGVRKQVSNSVSTGTLVWWARLEVGNIADFSRFRLLGAGANLVARMKASARMNQYERDKHTPDVSMVDRIAKVLNLPTTYFYAQRDDEAEFLKRLHLIPDSSRGHLLDVMEQMVQQPGKGVEK